MSLPYCCLGLNIYITFVSLHLLSFKMELIMSTRFLRSLDKFMHVKKNLYIYRILNKYYCILSHLILIKFFVYG
jgi:hypothetical protein